MAFNSSQNSRRQVFNVESVQVYSDTDSMADGSKIPAMPPPPGVQSNFVNPEYRGYQLIIISAVFVPIAFITLCLRTWTRLFIVRSFRIDDVLMIIAMAISIGMAATASSLVNFGLGKHIWDVPWSEYKYFPAVDVAAAIQFCVATGCAKCSVLAFYLRIFPSPGFHKWIYVLIFIAAGYNFASVWVNVLACKPLNKMWDLSVQGGHCVNMNVFYLANAGLGIFTDFATVCASIPQLHKLSMPLKQKIAIGCLLALGCCVGIISCIRLRSLVDMLHTVDNSWATTDGLLWCCLELNIGIACGCMTALRPFMRRYMPALIGSTKDHGSYNKDSSGQHSIALGNVSKDKSSRPSRLSKTLTPWSFQNSQNRSESIEDMLGSLAREDDHKSHEGIVRTISVSLKKEQYVDSHELHQQ